MKQHLVNFKMQMTSLPRSGFDAASSAVNKNNYPKH